MKNILKFIGLALIVISLAFTNTDKRTIVIDVSHGGKDTGASIDGVNEKEVALGIANKIKTLSQDSNVEIILTRDSDQFVSLKDRAAFINSLKPEFVISIHANSSNETDLSGTEIFISDKNKASSASKVLATKFQTAFQKQNAQIKKANFFLLRNINFPSVYLEVGYLSNPNDRKYLSNESGQTQIAKTIVEVIQE